MTKIDITAVYGTAVCTAIWVEMSLNVHMNSVCMPARYMTTVHVTAVNKTLLYVTAVNITNV